VLALRGRDLPRWAVWLGAIAPDLPLLVLSVSYYYYYTLIIGWSRRSAFRHLFSEHYYFDPLWICAHNFLHAPFILWVVLGVSHLFKWRWVFWFCAACLLHAGVDILTHADDGPLLFFPFDWQYRFASPVSYWDPQYHGRVFSRFELGLDIGLSLFLFYFGLLKKGPKRELQ